MARRQDVIQGDLAGRGNPELHLVYDAVNIAVGISYTAYARPAALVLEKLLDIGFNRVQMRAEHAPAGGDAQHDCAARIQEHCADHAADLDVTKARAASDCFLDGGGGRG